MENEVINSVGCIHKEFDEQKDIALKGYKAYQKVSSVKDVLIILACFLLCDLSLPFAVNGGRNFRFIDNLIYLIFIFITVVAWCRNIAGYKNFEKILLSEENRKVSFEIGNGYLKITKASYYLTGKKTSQETETGIINLKDDVCKVIRIRTPNLYFIVLPNKSFNVIPLNIFTTEEIQQIDEMFSNTLRRKYKVLKDKKKG